MWKSSVILVGKALGERSVVPEERPLEQKATYRGHCLSTAVA